MRDAVGDVLARETAGDVLVFLPGAAEIRRTRAALADPPLPGDPHLLPLHGSLPPQDQDAALAPSPDGRSKVVLATDLAESSLTIDGVTAVVDAGLSREPRFDPATGMTGLVTLPASRAAADQRAGRAGRTAPGVCVRLWPAREHATRDPHPRPAIVTDDLTPAALEVAVWGAEVADLPLLDQPPPDAWRRARETLTALGALDAAGRPTAHGRALAELPLHPRLAHLVVAGAARGQARLAAEVAAVLGDRDPLVTSPQASDADLTTRVRWLRGERLPGGLRARRGARARRRREADRLQRLATVGQRPSGGDATSRPAGATQTGDGDRAGGAQPDGPDLNDPDRAGALVLLGWPERVAQARPDRRGGYLLAAGRGAELHPAGPLAGEEWLAVAHLDRGATAARIHLAAPVDLHDVRTILGAQIHVEEEVAWRDGDVVAERRERLGALVLDRAQLTDRTPPRCSLRSWTVCAPTGSSCSRGGVTTGSCRHACSCCTAPSVRPGPTCPTPRCWHAPTRPSHRSSRGHGAAPTWRGSPPATCCAPRCPAGGCTNWTGSPPPTSRSRRAAASASTTSRGTGPSWPCGCRSCSSPPRPRRSWTAACPCCCTCCRPPADPCRSPTTWPASGSAPTPRSALSCVAATRSTPGPRTRWPHARCVARKAPLRRSRASATRAACRADDQRGGRHSVRVGCGSADGEPTLLLVVST